ncbi:MAG: type II toxin-antitoxin system death-on-curing family toxin [Alphaproteobacteria bacterium]
MVDSVKSLFVEEIKALTIIAQKKAVEKKHEPIPDFSTRYDGKLESCLNTPFTSFGEVDVYPDLPAKASILFYLMVKNHPFQNGNKRIAVITLGYFLYKNQHILYIPDANLYQLATFVAASESEKKDYMMSILKGLIGYFMKPATPKQSN